MTSLVTRVGIGTTAAAIAATGVAPALAAGLTPPPGAVRVQKATGPGVAYARYRTSKSRSSVTRFYAKQLRSAGYTVTGPTTTATESSVFAKLNGRYAEVQAGGSSPTYFEVCTGTNRKQVTKCDSPSGAS